MNEPTDDELDAVIAEYRTRIYPQDMHPRFERAIMRAAIAKWGTPPAVVGEPYAQHAIWHVRDGDMGWDQYHDRSDPMPLGWDGDAPDEVIDLYTAAQAQAGAVPLTKEQIEAAAKKLAERMEYPWEFMPEPGRKNMRKHAQDVIGAAYPLGGKQ